MSAEVVAVVAVVMFLLLNFFLGRWVRSIHDLALTQSRELDLHFALLKEHNRELEELCDRNGIARRVDESQRPGGDA